MPLYRLHHADLSFPPATLALTRPNGLLAIGGDLRPERLLNAYRNGIFPWFDSDRPILWWSPDPRLVLRLDDFKVSRKLKSLARRSPYEITMDRAFTDVIRNCGAGRAVGTWITPAMETAYCRLHELGHAHSVEVWNRSRLIGGLYGVALGRMFYGESMFSLEDNASKLALERLVRQLLAWEFRLIDCQVSSDHLMSLGAVEIPRKEFLRQLSRLISESPPKKWEFDLPARELD
ncbi:MAG: leucyl/phenylalanyl-tRNA--protein transferase [Gammaproteobacteria bacterium]|nr:leucyl/phenylalanyl-tRNA--protein transferase [Gammaproteobacteria bacterium]